MSEYEGYVIKTARLLPWKTKKLPAATADAPPFSIADLKSPNLPAPPHAISGILIDCETLLINSIS